MAMCAGVQNESRPMDMCHEMSQYPPITTDTTAAKSAQMYQGTESSFAGAETAVLLSTGGRTDSVVAMVMVGLASVVRIPLRPPYPPVFS
jgi:hypothetical protein